jgi:hypothetical protein
VGSLSKRMQQVLDAVQSRLLAPPPARLSSDERAELEAALAAARRGEFASDAEVDAMYGRHGL